MNDAKEETVSEIENIVAWNLADKLAESDAAIIAKKYLTPDNLLIYISRYNVAASTVPGIKIQVFQRVEKGVSETAYQIFHDHRFTKYQNEMIFGTSPTGADGTDSVSVSQAEAEHLLTLLNNLGAAKETS